MINTNPSPIAATTAPVAAPTAPKPQAASAAPPADQFSFNGLAMDAPVPSKAEIVKMGYEKFTDWASSHAKDGVSELTYDEIAGGYADIKGEANKEAAASLKPEDSKALFGTADKIANWQTQRLETEYTYEGGGTMYTHAIGRDFASLQDVVGEAITDWNTTPAGPRPTLNAEGLAFKAGLADPTGGYVNVNDLHLNEDKEVANLSDAIDSNKALPAGPQVVFGNYIQNEANAWNGKGNN
jgi:hypothetical protein